MTDELENRLREVFAEDAAAAPDADYLAQGTVETIPSRRWSQVAMGLAAAVVVVAAGVTIFGNPFHSSPSQRWRRSKSQSRPRVVDASVEYRSASLRIRRMR